MNSPLPVSPDTLDANMGPSVPEASWLAEVPERSDVEEAMAATRESAPGHDEVTVMMLRMSGELGLQVISGIVQRLWAHPDTDWEERDLT